MEILAKLGINPAVMLAQAVNFFALLGILSFFIYRPLLGLLDARKQRIAEAEKNAEEIERRLKKATEDAEKELAKARKESSEILARTKQNAKTLEDELTNNAKEKVKKIVEEGKAQLATESAQATAQIQREVAQIILLATEKLLGREIKAKDQSSLVEEAIKEISNLKSKK